MAKPLQMTPWLIFVLSYLVIPSLGQVGVPPGPAQIIAPSLIVEGQSVTMTCSSTGGSPAPTVRWFKGDTEITTGVTTQTSGNTVTATLVFTAAKTDHYAVYECQVDNGVLQNPLKDTEFVFVNYPPDPPTLTGPTTLTAGDPGVWTCFSNDGYPAGVMTMKNQNTNTQFPGSQFTSASTADGFGFDVTGTLNWSPALANNGHTICCNVAHDTTLGAGNPQEVCLTLTINAPLAVNAPVTSYTPTIGNSVTLQCVVTSGTATSITWLKEGQALTISSNNRLSGGSPTTPSLTISNVQSSDGGNYVCRAANAVSTVNTNTINLNPQGTPPVVTIPLPNYSQTYGQSITIACQVSSPNSPLQEVQWTFTNSNSQVTDPIVIGTGKYSGSTTASPSLTINNLDFTDEGVYRCRARNLIGTTSSATTATLDVQGTPPTANIPQNSYSAVYGDQLVITCNVNNANPAVTSVVWQKTTNGATTTINSGDSGYQGSTPTTPSLTINFVTQNSAGTYTCRATNVVDTGISNPTTVTITGGILTVSQSPNSANVLGGSTTTITCTASGQPAANGVSWLFTPTGGTQQTLTLTNRYSGAQPTNPSLTISNFQQSDAGTYVCRVSNVAGQATSPTTTVLTYIEQLTININPSDPVNIVGDPSRQITCSISGTPQAFTVNWYRRPINGGTRTQITSSSKYTLVSSFTSPVLTINNIQETDEQDYFCEATNTAGTVTSSRSRLTVNGGLNTISISPANQDVIQGTNQLITCTVSGQPNPTSIRWFFTPNGGSQQQLFIANSNGKYSGGTTTNPSMTVNNFQSGDAGTYFCQAINAAGTATSSNSVLNYLGILSVTVTPASQTAIIGDASATIACQVSGSPQATDWSWTKTVPGGNTEVIQRGTNNGKIQVANSATNPNLIISNIVQSDEANYVCRATNGAGQQISSSSFLDVQGTAPSINIEPSSQQAVIGDTSAIFQCTVTATPQATTWSWTFNPADGSNPVTIGQGTDNTQYLVDNSASRPHLTIRTIVASDAGTYSCTATNTVGTQTSQPATLTVTGAVLTVTISPSSANVVRGNTQQIQCTINGFPTAQGIQWFFTPSGSTQAQSVTISGRFSGGTVGNPHLTITNFQSGDAGTYRCAATNAAGTGTSGNSVLTYVEFLVVTTSPSDSTAVIGDASATIQCTITGVPAATSWSWTRRPLNGNVGTAEDVTAGAKYTIANSASNPNLVINNIAEDDERDYYCHATNLAGNVISSVRARLIVNGDLLSVSISPSADNVLMGTNKDVTCTVNGIPAATNIIWYFTPPNGAEQTLTLTPAKYTGGTTTNPSITILNFQQSDGGTYVCAAQNAVGLQRSLTSVLTYMEQLTISVSPADGVRLYGDASHTIQCSISGTPAPFSTSWSYRPINGGTLQQISPSAKYSIASSNTAPHLTINNIIESDERDYFCQASNIAGTQVSTRARLIVNGALLTVVVSPSSQNVQIGTTQTITCDITGDPSVTEVQWRFSPSTGGNPRIINVGTSNGKYTGGSINNYDLTVTNFQSSDSGNYVCQATNAVGQANSNPSTLTFVQLLTVTVSPADNSVEYGTNQVVIDCVISGTPDATSYSWTRRPIDGLANTAVDISTGTKYTISNSNTRPTLTIMNIVEADEQDYYCSATNIVGTTTSSRARLIVTGDLLTVDISPAQANVIRGNTQVISCQVTGTPSVTLVSWTKDGTNINIGGTQGKYSGGTPGNPSLTITNFQSTDAGTYVCTATNAVGPKSSSNSVLTYIENLSLTVSPAQGSAILGTSQYVISCAITGSPQATSWKWVKNPGNANAETIVMGTNSNKYLVANSATNPSLTIKNIAQSDDANYRCEAENVAGTRQSTNARLIVTGQLPAITVTPLQQFPQYGASSLMISCTVQASPSADTVGWRKNSVDGTSSQVINAANSNGKYVITNSLTNPDLQINNIDFTDDANYQCFATNAVGTGESALARVDVTGSSPQVSIPSSSYSGIYGNNIEIPCTINGANPTHTQVNWYRVGTNNQLTTININDPSQYLGGTVANPALTIVAADNNDSGLYRCSATNVVGTGESLNTQITVLGGLLTVNVPTSTYTVLLGNQVSMVCTVTGTPSATDVWWEYRANNNQNWNRVDTGSNNRYSGGVLGTPTITITNAAFSDEGEYRCRGTNAAGTATSITATLDVTGSIPVVNVQTTQYSVNIGNSITLQCQVSSNPIHTSVLWQRVDANGIATDVDMTNSRYSGSMVTAPSLIISNAMLSDQGRYKCLATNAVGTGQSQQTFLTVIGSIPTVNVPQPQYSANTGSTVTLQCSYSANPTATQVRWQKDGVDIGDTSTTNKYGGSTLSSPSLIIYNAQESDEGSYTCRVTNSVGTGTSTSTQLTVVGNVPVVTVPQPTYTVDVGGSVTLTCQVTSDPAHSNVFWRKVTGGTETDINTNAVKYSGSTVNTPSLTISNAAFGDSGTYYCYATNSVGTGQSTGVVLSVTGTTPSVTLTQTNINANYGTDVTIGCVVSANPAATNVYWQKVTGANNAAVTIDMTNTAKYADGSVTSPSLRILNVDTSDQARYICYAVNSVGTGQSQQGTLNVIGSPPTVTFPQLTYTTNIGNTVTLVCNIVANPDYSSIYWTKTIGAGTPEQISTTGSTSTKYSGATVGAPNLIIYNVQPTDAGLYNCFATNVVGSGNGNQPVTLQVVGNPPTVTATIPSSAAVGTSVTITCSIDANPAVTSIIWQYITNNNANNIDIINNNRYSGGTLSTPSLTISPVQENDEGSYRCQATNTEGTGTSNQVFLDTTGDPPVNVAVTPNPITVQQGQTITATCSSSANPPASYEWRVFGTTTVIQTGPTLTISNAETTNANRYVCRAYNSFGSGEASTNVDVQHRPIVTLTDIPVTGSLGQSATINCQFTSNPFADNVQWKKLIGGVETNVNIDGNKYQGGTRSSPSLTILNLNGGDQAEYVCVVTNSVGTGRSQNGQLIVDLRTSPMGINIYPGQITVLEGNSFSIYCNATANPSPSYEWYHDDTKVGTGQTYTVTNSVWGPHDGLYTCKAFNVIGDQQATIDVDVKYPPVSAVTENTFTPTLNTGITLTCNTNANPSSISWKWFQNGYEMTDQTEKALYLDMDSAGDAGNYYCIAYNEVGQSAQIFFTVTVDTGATTTLIPATGAAVASAGGLTGGEIAAICLGILFFILLLIVLAVCCVLQGCCAWCCGAGAAEKDRRVTPDGKVDIPRFYEVPTVVTREPSLISKRDVSLHMAPAYSDDVRYVTTTAARPYYLPPIEYTVDEDSRRRRKKRTRRIQELRGDTEYVLEERVMDPAYSTVRPEEVEVVTTTRSGEPEYYFQPA